MIKLIKALIPERCALCGEPVEYGRNSPFCRLCHVKWECEKESIRRESSGLPVAEYPHRQNETERYGLTPHLFHYNPDNRDSASTALIFKLKHNATPRIVELVAAEFANLLTDSAPMLFGTGAEPENIAVTFVPRSREALKRDGYDHMERCAKATAVKLGFSFAKPFVRTSGAKEQKKLDSAGRHENARKTILLAGNNRLRQTFILLDDIVTTGASLNACAELLLTAGAKSVIAVVIAATVKK